MQPVVKEIRHRETGFIGASKAGATIDVSQGMQAQKKQKG